MLNSLYEVTQLYIVPILQMGQLRLRQTYKLEQGHPVCSPSLRDGLGEKSHRDFFKSVFVLFSVAKIIGYFW